MAWTMLQLPSKNLSFLEYIPFFSIKFLLSFRLDLDTSPGQRPSSLVWSDQGPVQWNKTNETRTLRNGKPEILHRPAQSRLPISGETPVRSGRRNTPPPPHLFLPRLPFLLPCFRAVLIVPSWPRLVRRIAGTRRSRAGALPRHRRRRLLCSVHPFASPPSVIDRRWAPDTSPALGFAYGAV